MKKRTIFIGILVLTMFISSVCFYLNFQFWTHRNTNHFIHLLEYKTNNIYGLRGQQILVNRGFQRQMDKLNIYAVDNDVDLIVIQSYRRPYQKLKDTVVSPVGNSNHLCGYAVDINIKYDGVNYLSHDLCIVNFPRLPSQVKRFISNVRKDNELRWGGDFKSEDPVHIDFPLNHINLIVWKEKAKMCQEDYYASHPKWMVWE